MWTKNKQARVKIFFEALLVVLVLHALLLVLFRMPNTGQVQEVPRTNRISLLPHDSPRRFDRHAFDEWLLYADPTLIAKPNENFGYEILVAPRGLRNNFPSVPFAPVDFRFNFTREIAPPVPLARDTMPVRNFPLPAFRYPVTEKDRHLTFPLVLGDDGHMIQGLFGGVAALDDLIKAAVIGGPSIIRISRWGEAADIPRFVILKSCGDPMLDRLAVRTLVGSPNFLDGQSGDMVLNVYWKPEGESEP